MSAEDTFAVDIDDPALLLRHLLAQSLRVAARLSRQGQAGKGVVVKIKDVRHHITTRRLALRRPVNDPDSIFEAAKVLLPRFQLNGKPVRLCGVGVVDLQPDLPQLELFVDPAVQRRKRLEAVRGEVARRFGEGALTRATLLTPDGEPDG